MHELRIRRLLVASTVLAGTAAAQASSSTDSGVVYDPTRAEIELTVTDESFWAAWRDPFAGNDGAWAVEFFANDDDDVVVSGGVWRTGGPRADGVHLGVGIEAFVVSMDGLDDEAYGLALSGLAQYRLPTEFPTTLSLEASFAPDVTTFDGAEGILDLDFRAELEISDNARAFIGYRLIELEIDGMADYEPQDSFYLGIGLGL